jgi:Tfp pilus assembly PilM family ATPase
VESLLATRAASSSSCWLAGSQAGGAVLCEQLQQRLGIATRAFDPLASLLALPHDNANLMAAAPMLGVACGLALRGYA